MMHEHIDRDPDRPWAGEEYPTPASEWAFAATLFSVLAAVLFVAVCVLVLSIPARAAGSGPLSDYYQSLRSAVGTDCCGKGDCGGGARVTFKDGVWTAYTSLGTAVTITPEMMAGPPHPNGQAVFCYREYFPGFVTAFCFVKPGTQG